MVRTGSVAIAAITSCTNTSNPTVMVGAGLLARSPGGRGPDHGQDVARAGLEGGHRLPRVGRPDGAARSSWASRWPATAARPASATAARSTSRSPRRSRRTTWSSSAVLSGNRNFEGRIHPLARASYLASPPLVVAFALAGRVDIDLTTEPLGTGSDGSPVFLADIWPSPEEIRSVIGESIDPELFRRTYAVVFEGDHRWRALPIPEGDRYVWDDASTYVAKPPFFDGLSADIGADRRHRGGACPGRAGRLRHHRPHLARRLDRPLVAGRPVAPGAWRGAARVQLVWRAARPPRGDDARHVREHPAAQPPRRGQGGAVHGPPAVRRGGVHLRRGDALRGRGRAARSSSPAASTAPARRATGPPRAPTLLGVRAVIAESLRADPPLQPGGHGRAAAPVPARRERGVARADRARVVHDPRPGRWSAPRQRSP